MRVGNSVQRVLLSTAAILLSIQVAQFTCAFRHLAYAQDAAAQQTVVVRGTAGKAVQHSVVNFKAMAHDEAYGPMPLNEYRLIHRPAAVTSIVTRKDRESLDPAQPEASVSMPSADSTLQSSAPVKSFTGVNDNGTVIPPDTDGAVGPNHVMVAVNSQVVIEDRSGTTISAVSIAGFWSSLGVSDAFDPHLLYDPYANRWIFSAGSGESSANAAILIGVSQTSDPTGVWDLYKVPVDPAGATWADYPTLGFNRNWIVVQANLFTVSSGSFVNSSIWAFNKANLYAGGTGSFTLLKPNNGVTQLPAATYDPNVSTMYLVESASAGSAKLRVDTITGAVGAEVLTVGVAYPTGPSAWQSFSPTLNFAPQLGSTQKIDTDDDRLQSCVYRNGSLWASQTIYLPATGTPTQWW
jgi:hypothetical protein